ncbi:MAG: ECF transporter S component [Candidatus Cloacimonetes bacterium]|nr:ECF transporter S component [Candidatus Cloacimonadota bacterium]
MKKLTISEIVFIAVVATAMGIFWWAYTFIYDLLKPVLYPLVLENLLTGIWLMGALFFPYIIRKPGSAILGEMIAAFIQGFIARWGITSLIWGAAQAIPVEFFFLLLRYKSWNYFTMCVAGIVSAMASFVLSFFWEQWFLKPDYYVYRQYLSFLISGILLAGLLSKWLADGLKKTGILNQFEIAKNDHSN